MSENHMVSEHRSTGMATSIHPWSSFEDQGRSESKACWCWMRTCNLNMKERSCRATSEHISNEKRRSGPDRSNGCHVIVVDGQDRSPIRTMTNSLP
jgi:hypothetical protein